MYKELTFKDVAEFINGRAFKPSEWSKEGLPIIRIQNLNNPEKEFNFFDGEVNDKYIINKGDLLISWSASLGVFIWSKEKAVLNQHIFKVNVFENIINKKFFYYLAKTKLQEMATRVHGSTMKHITKKNFDKIKINLPPLPIQKHIVSILEKAESLKQKREATNKETQKIIQSIFYDMFGDPVKNEKGWEIKEISKLTLKVEKGNPSDIFGNNNFKYIDISSIDRDFKRINSAQEIKGIEAPSRARQIVKENDVIVSTVRPNLNSVAVVSSEFDNQICSTGYCVLRSDSKEIIPRYLFEITKMKKFVDILMGKSKGASYPAVSNKDITEIKIAVPPLPLQKEFAKRVQLIESIQSNQQHSTQEINTLFDALMQKAFKGELA